MYRSGWANSCGIELFTHGWVTCEVTVVIPVLSPGVASPGAASGNGLRTQAKYDKIYKDETLDIQHRKILIQEDEELIVMTILLIREGII